MLLGNIKIVIQLTIFRYEEAGYGQGDVMC